MAAAASLRKSVDDVAHARACACGASGRPRATHCADVERMTSVLLDSQRQSGKLGRLGLGWGVGRNDIDVHYCFASSYNKTRRHTTMILIHYSPPAHTHTLSESNDRREEGGRGGREGT